MLQGSEQSIWKNMMIPLQFKIHVIDMLSNHPDDFTVDCPECRGAIEVPSMKERDGRSEEDKLSTSGHHLSMYRLECIHCGWNHPFVFPMPGE